MSPKKQRIAIAEACGWKDCHATGGLPCGIAPGEAEHRQVPDCTADLNVIHEAEKVLLISDTAWADYGNNLQEVCRWYAVGIVPDYRRDLASLAKIAHATALQRSEALLRTIGKWEETT